MAMDIWERQQCPICAEMSRSFGGARIRSFIDIERETLYAAESETLLGAAYMRANGLDPDAVHRFAGCLAILPIRLHPTRHFDFADDGLPAAIIEAFDADGASVIDLVAWPVKRPDKVATLLGNVGILGAWQLHNPASYTSGPIRIFRTPLAWLAAGAEGAACAFDDLHAAAILADAFPGDWKGEDADHEAELRRLATTARSTVEFRRAS